MVTITFTQTAVMQLLQMQLPETVIVEQLEGRPDKAGKLQGQGTRENNPTLLWTGKRERSSRDHWSIPHKLTIDLAYLAIFHQHSQEFYFQLNRFFRLW